MEEGTSEHEITDAKALGVTKLADTPKNYSENKGWKIMELRAEMSASGAH
jgi:hypothetical protein